MNAIKAAPLYIQTLAKSIPADHLPSEATVTKKGSLGTQAVKRIVLARLGQTGQIPHRYRGDTYTYQFQGDESRFSFRVAADAGRVQWWSNTSLADLESLIEDQAVMHLVWHPPGGQR